MLCKHTHTCIHKRSRTPINIQRFTGTHSHAHTHIHTHKHTYIHIHNSQTGPDCQSCKVAHWIAAHNLRSATLAPQSLASGKTWQCYAVFNTNMLHTIVVAHDACCTQKSCVQYAAFITNICCTQSLLHTMHVAHKRVVFNTQRSLRIYVAHDACCTRCMLHTKDSCSIHSVHYEYMLHTILVAHDACCTQKSCVQYAAFNTQSSMHVARERTVVHVQCYSASVRP